MAVLIPVEEAQARLMALGAPLGVERPPIAAAAGRWTAEPVIARRDQPAVDLSAMDGYAVRHADLPGPLRVIGQSAAGNGFSGAVGHGEAVRIFTGAPVPEGADTVVIQEDCARDGDVLRVMEPPQPGRNIRRRGNDFAAGQVLLGAGMRLTPQRLGAAIMAGHGDIAVYRRPRVAVISTGDELVPPGVEPTRHQIPSSNGPMIAAMLTTEGALADDFGIIGDRKDDIYQAIERARDHDVILTIGGASVGDLDLVKPALDDAGAQLDFIKAALKPGKPLMAGTLGKAVVIGLPGNPVSAFVTAFLFAVPLVRRMMGAAEPLPATLPAITGCDLPAGGARTEFLRARIGGGMVWPLDNQDSAALAALARADVLIRRDAHAAPAPAGTAVPVLAVG